MENLYRPFKHHNYVSFWMREFTHIEWDSFFSKAARDSLGSVSWDCNVCELNMATNETASLTG